MTFLLCANDVRPQAHRKTRSILRIKINALRDRARGGSHALSQGQANVPEPSRWHASVKNSVRAERR